MYRLFVVPLLWSCLFVETALAAAASTPVVTSLVINEGQAATLSSTVVLHNSVRGAATHYQASESKKFSGAKWLRYSPAPKFKLSKKAVTHTVYFRVKSGKKISKSKSAKIKIVNGVPITVWSFTVNDGEDLTLKRTVNVKVNLSGPAKEFQLSETNDFAGAVWLPFAPETTFELSEGDGQKWVLFKARSEAGVESWVSGDSIILNDTPHPQGGAINEGDAATNYPVVRMSVPATGTPTHVMFSQYQDFRDGYWITYQAQLAYMFTDLRGGQKTVYVKLKDEYSESDTFSYSIMYDEPPGVGRIDINGGAAKTQSRDVNVSMTTYGGASHYMLSESPSFAGGSWQALPAANFSVPFRLSDGDGTKTVYVKLKDAMSGSVTESARITYDLPIQLQSWSIEGAEGSPGATGVRVVTLRSAATGGPKLYRASEAPDFSGAAWRAYKADASFTLSAGNGVKTVYFELKDDISGTGRLQGTIQLTERQTTLLSATVVPSNLPQTFEWKDQVKVVFPPLSAAFLGGPRAFTIKTVPAPPAYQHAALQGLSIYEISLQGITQFGSPLTIELAYDPQTLRSDLTATQQLSAASFEAAVNSWIMEKHTVDEAREKVIIQTNHLSHKGVQKPKTGYGVSTHGFFRYTYNYQLDYPGVPGQDAESYKDLVRGHLDGIRAVYGAVTSGSPSTHFRLPARIIDVFIDEYGADAMVSYDGSITVPRTYLGAELVGGLAHEYFHAVQNEYLNVFAMDHRRWFIDATADWAMGKIAGQAVHMGEGIGPKYLEKSITDDPSVADRHKYHTAHLLDSFLPDASRFKAMVEHVFAGGEADTALDNFLTSNSLGSLGDVYDSFAKNFIFGGGNPIALTVPLSSFVNSATSYSRDTDPKTVDMSLDKYSAKLVEVNVGTDTEDRLIRVKWYSGAAGVNVHAYAASARDAVAGAPGTVKSEPPGSTAWVNVPKLKKLYLLFVNTTRNSATGRVEIDDLIPVITSVSPEERGPGDTIVIAGRRFGDKRGTITAKPLGGNTDLLEILSWSDSAIHVKLPDWRPGEIEIKVVRNEGMSTSSEPWDYRLSWLPRLQQKIRGASISVSANHTFERCSEKQDDFGGDHPWTCTTETAPQSISAPGAPQSLEQIAPLSWSGATFSALYGGPITVNNEPLDVHYAINGSVSPLGDTVNTITIVYTWRTNLTCSGACIANVRQGTVRIEAHDIPLESAGGLFKVEGAQTGGKVATISSSTFYHSEYMSAGERYIHKGQTTYKSSTYDSGSSVSGSFN